MATGSLIEILRQSDQFSVQPSLVGGVESEAPCELTGLVFGGLTRMAVDRTRMRVRTSGFERSIDSAIEFERMVESSDCVLGVLLGFFNHSFEIRLINVHDQQR